MLITSFPRLSAVAGLSHTRGSLFSRPTRPFGTGGGPRPAHISTFGTQPEACVLVARWTSEACSKIRGPVTGRSNGARDRHTVLASGFLHTWSSQPKQHVRPSASGPLAHLDRARWTKFLRLHQLNFRSNKTHSFSQGLGLLHQQDRAQAFPAPLPVQLPARWIILRLLDPVLESSSSRSRWHHL